MTRKHSQSNVCKSVENRRWGSSRAQSNDRLDDEKANKQVDGLMKETNGSCPGRPAMSYLTLDIHLSEGSLPSRLEKVPSFFGEYPHFAFTFFEESLTTVVTYKPRTLVIRFETKFFGKKAKFNVR